jgi:hypothetical protein
MLLAVGFALVIVGIWGATRDNQVAGLIGFPLALIGFVAIVIGLFG